MAKIKEVFKPIRGYEGLYEISNFGNVKSLAKEWIAANGGIHKKDITILQAIKNGKGYLNINLCKNNKVKVTSIHALVYDHFGKGKRDGIKLQIDHIDNSKINNRIDNLQLLTNRENTSKGKLQYKKSSKFIGVYWSKTRDKWMAYIKINGMQKNLGRFINEYNAHLAYQKALASVSYPTLI